MASQLQTAVVYEELPAVDLTDPRDACPLVIRCMNEKVWASSEEQQACEHNRIGACYIRGNLATGNGCAFHDPFYALHDKALGLTSESKRPLPMWRVLALHREGQFNAEQARTALREAA